MATPEKQPGLPSISFCRFAPNRSKAIFEQKFSAPEARSSPRKPGSLTDLGMPSL
jgi:hypothetical protein